MEDIIKFLENKINLRGSQRSFLKEAKLGINTFTHLKKEKDIKLSTLWKMLDVLNCKIEIVEKE